MRESRYRLIQYSLNFYQELYKPNIINNRKSSQFTCTLILTTGIHRINVVINLKPSKVGVMNACVTLGRYWGLYGTLFLAIFQILEVLNTCIYYDILVASRVQYVTPTYPGRTEQFYTMILPTNYTTLSDNYLILFIWHNLRHSIYIWITGCYYKWKITYI